MLHVQLIAFKTIQIKETRLEDVKRLITIILSNFDYIIIKSNTLLSSLRNNYIDILFIIKKQDNATFNIKKIKEISQVTNENKKIIQLKI